MFPTPSCHSPPLLLVRAAGMPSSFRFITYSACEYPLLSPMAKDYQAVPLDEEQSRSSSESTIYEKDRLALRLEDDKFQRNAGTRASEFISKHWPWIGHAVLLTLSMTLFTLSFCNRTARPSDLQVTQQFSSYCTHPSKILPLSACPD